MISYMRTNLHNIHGGVNEVHTVMKGRKEEVRVKEKEEFTKSQGEKEEVE